MKPGAALLITALMLLPALTLEAMAYSPSDPELDLGDLIVCGDDCHTGELRIRVYTVVEGDTVSGIAARFGLDIETLRWSNPDLAHNPDRLYPGDRLVILPFRGAYHTVKPGETLAQIAHRYGVAEEDIVHCPLNDLQSPYELVPGQALVIPGGRISSRLPHPSLAPDSPFAWPIVGRVTHVYSASHRAVDIGAPYGSAVYAARAGRVIHTGWARTGYGFTVILDHGDGLQSLYSHMKGDWVTEGQWVARGQLIGEVGSTGNSSGPHVHFEIRVGGVRVNPLDYLPNEK